MPCRKPAGSGTPAAASAVTAIGADVEQEEVEVEVEQEEEVGAAAVDGTVEAAPAAAEAEANGAAEHEQTADTAAHAPPPADATEMPEQVAPEAPAAGDDAVGGAPKEQAGSSAEPMCTEDVAPVHMLETSSAVAAEAVTADAAPPAEPAAEPVVVEPVAQPAVPEEPAPAPAPAEAEEPTPAPAKEDPAPPPEAPATPATPSTSQPAPAVADERLTEPSPGKVQVRVTSSLHAVVASTSLAESAGHLPCPEEPAPPHQEPMQAEPARGQRKPNANTFSARQGKEVTHAHPKAFSWEACCYMHGCCSLSRLRASTPVKRPPVLLLHGAPRALAT